jgi:predicted kinase
VIVDATFREDVRRGVFLELARKLCVPVVLFVCTAGPETVRARLAARTGDASDAGWDVYRQAAGAWEPASPDVAPHLVTVATDPAADPVAAAAQALRDRGLECGM